VGNVTGLSVGSGDTVMFVDRTDGLLVGGAVGGLVIGREEGLTMLLLDNVTGISVGPCDAVIFVGSSVEYFVGDAVGDLLACRYE
jgi:hypothetical protein